MPFGSEVGGPGSGAGVGGGGGDEWTGCGAGRLGWEGWTHK
jgi:hypothetical protein